MLATPHLSVLGRIQIDLLTAREDEGAIATVAAVPIGDEVPAAPVEALVYLKLKSPRLKDASDIVELLKIGVDATRCRSWLDANAPSLRTRFDDLVARARAVRPGRHGSPSRCRPWDESARGGCWNRSASLPVLIRHMILGDPIGKQNRSANV